MSNGANKSVLAACLICDIQDFISDLIDSLSRVLCSHLPE